MAERILITGANGLIGSHIRQDLSPDHELVIPTQNEMDIRDTQAVIREFESHSPEIVIHCAAYTNVPEAQKQENHDEVWAVNVEGTENIARACNDAGIFLIHLSTRFVFPGENSRFIPENEPIPLDNKGLSYYGESKKEAEQILAGLNNVAIVRLTYPYGSDFPDLPAYDDKMRVKRGSDTLFKLFNDQHFTPTYINDLVRGVRKIAELKRPGIYHIASDVATPHSFVTELITIIEGADPHLEEGSIQALSEELRLIYPPYSLLSTGETENVLGIQFTPWATALRDRKNIGKVG